MRAKKASRIAPNSLADAHALQQHHAHNCSAWSTDQAAEDGTNTFCRKLLERQTLDQCLQVLGGLVNRGLSTRYLLTDHPTFGVAMQECANWVRTHGITASPEEIAAFEQRVAEGIHCLNIAGLCDPSKRNGYGVDLNDLVINAHKIGITPDEMKTILAHAAWAGAEAE